jgi:alkyl sulfatase BDS1-like metallo-beta-lactamase superfamily hydrolase
MASTRPAASATPISSATTEGHVIFDTGLATQGAKQRRLLLETVPKAPITHVILSHSHQDHVGGTGFWVEDGTEIVAHREYAEEQRYLKELEDYLWFRNRTLFSWMPESPPKSGPFAYGGVEPTLLVDDPDPLRFQQGGVRFEVLPTPGAEGADNISLWLPDQGILFSGDFFGPNFPQFPNIFTMRGEKIRKPVEYIASLERLIALEPEMIVPSHQDPIVGREQIKLDLIKMRDAVRYVHDATIAGMNAGKTVEELMVEIQLPPELELTQLHGRVSWAVKSIWEYYATWFHFDSTTALYPVHVSTIRPELAELAGVDRIVERARFHVAADRPVKALHLLEVALEGDPMHREGLETRRAALEILLTRAEAGYRNSYEMDWLKYRIRVTDEALAAKQG